MKRVIRFGLLSAMLIAFGCNKEQLAIPDHPPKEGGTVVCHFALQPQAPDQVVTKAIDDDAVNNVWVVQCSSAGAVVGSPVYIFGVALNINDLAVELQAVASTVNFYVNTSNNTLFNGVTTEAEVKAIAQDFSYNEASMTELPMFGTWAGTPAAGVINTAIVLQRAVAKVTFNLTSQLPATSGMLLTKVQLKRIPKSVLYVPSSEAVYPAAEADNFTDRAADYTHATGEVLGGTKTFVWYLPENLRGVGSATTQKQKTAATAPAGQGDFCTYIELAFTTVDMDDITYRIWLGANNRDDYNVERNTHYTVSTAIVGANLSDTRIEIIRYSGDLLVGPFGGTIVGDVASGYKFSKMLFTTASYENGSSETLWAKTSEALIDARGIDLEDGKKNTWALNKGPYGSLENYAPANTCFKKNVGWTSISQLQHSDYRWFLPAPRQLQCYWVVGMGSRSGIYHYDNSWSSYCTQQGGYYASGTTGVNNAFTAATSLGRIRCAWESLYANSNSPMVYRGSDDKIYLDFGPDTGFPQGAVTTVSKIQSDAPSNTSWYPDMATSRYDGTINATVYRKLEVAKGDGTTGLSWAQAYIYCRDTYPATGGGTGWRLPTQRELTTINTFYFAFNALLPTVSGTQFGYNDYWSATNGSATGAYSSSFVAATISLLNKRGLDCLVRCVREVSE